METTVNNLGNSVAGVGLGGGRRHMRGVPGRVGISIRRLCPPVRVRSRRYGTLCLRHLTLNDLVFIEGLRRAGGVEPREAVIRVISHQLERPTLQRVEEWSDKLLLRVGNIWVAQNRWTAALGSTPSDDPVSVVAPVEVTPAPASSLTFEGLRDDAFSLVDEANEQARSCLRKLHWNVTANLGAALGFDRLRRQAVQTHVFRAAVADFTRVAGFAADIARFRAAPPDLNVFPVASLKDVFGAFPGITAPALPIEAPDLSPFRDIIDSTALSGVSADVVRQAREFDAVGIVSLPDILGAHVRRALADVQEQADALVGIRETVRSINAWRADGLLTAMGRLQADWEPQLSGIGDVFAALTGPYETILGFLRHQAEDLFRGFRAPTDRHLAFFGQVIRGKEALDSTGLGYLEHFISPRWLAQVGRTDVRTRAATLTRRLHQVTCSSEFEAALFEDFGQFRELRPWRNALRQALDNHRRRQYHASIAGLLIIVEGVLTELMYARREAVRFNGKPHQVDVGGKMKRDGHNKPVKFGGLDSKIKQLRPGPDETLLQSVHADFLNQLPPDRNAVLHGNRAAYGSPKMSVQLLWALYMLGRVLVEVLHKRTSPLPVTADSLAPGAGARQSNDVGGVLYLA